MCKLIVKSSLESQPIRWQVDVTDLREDSLQFLCCPLCHNELLLDAEETARNEITSGFLRCHICKVDYKIDDGVPEFLLSEFLDDKDKRWMRAYDRMARSYDLITSFLSPLLSVGLEPLERKRWVRRLQTKEGDRVLDVSTGTGRNLSFIIGEIGTNGRLAAMDISKRVLWYARMKIERRKWENVELQRANASYLPYKNGTFDAVMHVGGINTFGEKRRALCEMVRVAKPKAKIVIVDEGLAPGKENTYAGRFLLRTNALYWSRPPIRLLPKTIENLQITWGTLPLLGILPFWPYYIMEFQKSQKEE